MLQITITGVDKTTGKLILSDRGHSKAKRHEDVHWKVNDPEKIVVGISAILWQQNDPDPNNRNIFTNDPPRPQGSNPVAKHWIGRVNQHESDTAVYHYGISWVDNKGGEHPNDPIISIKPTRSINSLEIIAIGMGVLGLTTMLMLTLKSRAREKRLKRDFLKSILSRF